MKLNTCYFPWELEQAVADFVVSYNTQRYHESLHHLTPEEVYRSRKEEVLTPRERIKPQTGQQRCTTHQQGLMQAF